MCKHTFHTHKLYARMKLSIFVIRGDSNREPSFWKMFKANGNHKKILHFYISKGNFQ